MNVLKVVFTVLEALLALNLLIFVHELGHFLAARWRGMKVDRFAIWFGKPIWKQRINGVEYVLGWIPAGGYVALPQMATMEMIEGKVEDGGKPLPAVSPWDKIIVAFAGPLFSFLLAVAFAFLVWGVGKPEQATGNSTLIGWADPEGPAWQSGLRPGDRILAIDGEPVSQFGPSTDSVMWRIITSEGETIEIKYERDGHEDTVQVKPYKAPTKWYERKALRKILIGPAQPAIIGEVATNSPAALAGLRSGDEVIAVNGNRIYSPAAVMRLDEATGADAVQPVTLTLRRDGNEFERTLLPERPIQPADAKPSLGITAWVVNSDEVLVYPNPLTQIRDSAGQIFATIGAVFSSKSDVGVQQLGGAVMIIRVYKNFFESENGWRRVLWFSVILNVNLALLNLLPFPVLDGGHITLSLVEAIRRRPVSARLLNYLQSACAVVLIGFMLFIAFYDTGDWVRSARKDRAQPIIFAPKPLDVR